MENASKGLLIAGSILLFILLSTFAAYVFTRTRNHTSEIYNLMLSSDVDTFNQKFLKYEDRELTIQDVVSIINLAKDNNESEKMPIIVKVTSSASIEGMTGTDLLANNIDISNILYNNIGKKYKAEMSYGDNSNLIEKIEIKNS